MYVALTARWMGYRSVTCRFVNAAFVVYDDELV